MALQDEGCGEAPWAARVRLGTWRDWAAEKIRPCQKLVDCVIRRFTCELSVLFCWSTCLFLCQYCSIFVDKVLQHKLKLSRAVIQPFLSCVCFDLGDLKQFEITLEFFLFLWKIPLTFDSNCDDSVRHFGYYGHSHNSNFSNQQIQDKFLYSWLLPSFVSVSWFSVYTSFISFVKLFYSFSCYCIWGCFLDFFLIGW
jgi:hypothetical protein